MSFRNDHLSYSRLARYERCPRLFALQYIERHPSAPSGPAQFGVLVHRVLERLVRDVVDDERVGPLSLVRALEHFRAAWSASGLRGLGLFTDGEAIVRAFVRDQGVVDHRDVLALEQPFELSVGPFTVVGAIDRVDRVGEEAIEVIDYKTNVQLFRAEEVESSLQLSLYQLAAQRLWPWAREVRLTFHMLRHGVRQATRRTPDQLEAALGYVESLGRQTETATEFPARLGPGCAHCDQRQHCAAYTAALQDPTDVAAALPEALDAVAREREEIAARLKVLHTRKDALEGVLRTVLQNQPELVAGGTRFTMFPTARIAQPLDATLAVLERYGCGAREALLSRLGVVDRDALLALVQDAAARLGRSELNLLRVELDAVAEKTYTPRLWARAVSR